MNLRLSVIRGAALSLVTLLLTAPASADLSPGPRPRPRPTPVPVPAPAPPKAIDAVPLAIRVDPQAKESVLKIPRKLLPAGKLGMEDEPAAPGTIRNVIAGLAMSAGLIGAFFIRRSRTARLLVVAFIGMAAVAAAGTIAANAPPPPHDNGPPVAAKIPASVDGKVVIQIVNSGDSVTLTLAGNGNGETPVPNAAPAPAP